MLLAMLGSLAIGESTKAADIQVTSDANAGANTLRAALRNAQPGDRVVFAFDTPRTIVLTDPLPEIDGDLSFANIGGPVTVDASGAGGLTITAGAVDLTDLNLVGAGVLADPDVTLYGDGLVTANIGASGTIAPGTAPAAGTVGTYEVNGDLDAEDAEFQIDLFDQNGVEQADQVVVSGTLTTTGSTLSLNPVGDEFRIGDRFLILDAGTLVDTPTLPGGRVNVPNRPFLRIVVDGAPEAGTFSDSFGVIVEDNNNPFSAVVSGCNQSSAVQVLDELRLDGSLPSVITPLRNSSADATIAAVNQLSGSIYPSLISAEIFHVQNNLESIRDRAVLQRYAGVEPPALMPWVRGYGVVGNATQDSCLTPGYSHEFGGMEVGFAVSNKQGLSSHVFGHFGGGTLEMDGVNHQADIESYRGGGSVEYVGERFYALAAGGAGVQSYDVGRSLSALEGSTLAQSSFDGSAQFGYFELGTVFSHWASIWVPYVGLHGTRVELDSINETGDDNFALSNDGGNGESLRGVLGLGVEQSGRTPMGFATTRMRFGWMHEYLDPQETFVSTLASDSITSQITDRGVDPGRDWGFVRVQVDVGSFLGGQTSFGYQGQANSNTSFNALIGGIQWVR